MCIANWMKIVGYEPERAWCNALIGDMVRVFQESMLSVTIPESTFFNVLNVLFDDGTYHDIRHGRAYIGHDAITSLLSKDNRVEYTNDIDEIIEILRCGKDCASSKAYEEYRWTVRISSYGITCRAECAAKYISTMTDYDSTTILSWLTSHAVEIYYNQECGEDDCIQGEPDE